MKLIPRSSDISPGIDGICPGPFPPNGFTVLTDAVTCSPLISTPRC